MRRPWSRGLAGLVGAALCGCEPPSPDLEREPRPLDGAGAPAIIHFTRHVDLPALATAGRAGRGALIAALRRDAARAQGRTLALLRQRGIEPAARLWMINAMVVRLPDALAEEVARLPEVDHVAPDLLIGAPVADRRAGPALPWNLAAIRAPELWATGQRGAGTVVATLDTGVDVDHPDLAATWRSAAGWYDPYAQHLAPFDGNGHGTQVAGLAVGGDTSGEPVGVAPDASWIGARIYDDADMATVSAIHLALQWVLDPDGDPLTDDAADIVNGSWGYSQLAGQCYLELEPDLATLRAAQIATVFAAGNTGPYTASSISPANNPSAFAAGAVDEGLAVLADSARGPDACTGGIYPELVAPGANVRTTDLTQGGQFPSAYAVVAGTSFAAPHLAGAMALLRGAHPAATVQQLEDALTTTAVDLAPTGADNRSGAGVPDLIAAAARLADLVATPTCTDGDGDGYFAEPDCGTAVDCDDGAAVIHPGACDIKADGIDQDCDGRDRLKGKACR